MANTIFKSESVGPSATVNSSTNLPKGTWEKARIIFDADLDDVTIDLVSSKKGTSQTNHTTGGCTVTRWRRSGCNEGSIDIADKSDSIQVDLTNSGASSATVEYIVLLEGALNK